MVKSRAGQDGFWWNKLNNAPNMVFDWQMVKMRKSCRSSGFGRAWNIRTHRPSCWISFSYKRLAQIFHAIFIAIGAALMYVVVFQWELQRKRRNQVNSSCARSGDAGASEQTNVILFQGAWKKLNGRSQSKGCGSPRIWIIIDRLGQRCGVSILDKASDGSWTSAHYTDESIQFWIHKTAPRRTELEGSLKRRICSMRECRCVPMLVKASDRSWSDGALD